MLLREILIAVLIFVVSTFGQENPNYLWKIDNTTVGGYVQFNAKATSLESEAVGFADFKGVAVINDKWGVGIIASGLWDEKGRTELVDDGAYHLRAGYIGLYVEHIFSLTEDLKLSLSITSAQGEAYYRYDKDYRKEKVWSEEIIDKTTFHVFEPAIGIEHRLVGNFWLGITGSFRNTSPIELIDTDEQMLRKFNGGITFKYGLF